MVAWRRGPVVARISKPSRLDRAHALGFRAKQGFIVARVRVRRGGLRKIRPKGGRRQKRMGVLKFTPALSLKKIAEGRTAKRFPNLKILNSYWVWKDGKHEWYEVIAVDPHHNSVRNDPKLSWLARG